MKPNRKTLEKCKKIKLVLTDVDGVLTDGSRYFSEDGELLKCFHNADGMGVNILLRNGIKTVIVSKEKSKIVRKWATDMNISYVYDGILKKENELPKICNRFNLKEEEIAYIGDDVNDIALLKKVGFSSSPYDGIEQVKSIVDYVCKRKGGRGCFREVADMILISRYNNKIN